MTEALIKEGAVSVTAGSPASQPRLSWRTQLAERAGAFPLVEARNRRVTRSDADHHLPWSRTAIFAEPFTAGDARFARSFAQRSAVCVHVLLRVTAPPHPARSCRRAHRRAAGWPAAAQPRRHAGRVGIGAPLDWISRRLRPPAFSVSLRRPGSARRVRPSAGARRRAGVHRVCEV